MTGDLLVAPDYQVELCLDFPKLRQKPIARRSVRDGKYVMLQVTEVYRRPDLA